MGRRWQLVLLAAVASLVVGGCSSDDAPPRALRVAWHEVSLPMPPGPVGRIGVRDATVCDGTWYVVGAVFGDDGSSRPAAWTSAGARTWRSIALDPTTYYARRNILTSVACRDGRIAALGARSGGAHGNPRTSSWVQRADGTLVDVRAPFVLFGGSQAVSVDRIAAGPDGWMIAGNRTSGAAVWTSPDATGFRLHDDDPALMSDADHLTTALDLADDGSTWTVVGRAQVPHRIAPEPLAWTSADGSHWSRQAAPAATKGFADLERVVRVGDRLYAVGLRDQRFGTWERRDGRWQAGATFGSLRGGTGAPFVSGLAAVPDGLVAAASDGSRFRLWARNGDADWREVTTPTRPRNSGDAQLTVAAHEDTVLLLADDGTAGRMWTAAWPH